MNSGHGLQGRLAAGVAFAALALTALPAAAVDVYLAAKSFSMTMPGGTSVPMWGYVADAGGACYNAANDAARLTCVNALPNPTVPGPRLTVPPAEPGNALRVFLSNGLPVPTSIVIPGQRMPHTQAGSGPTWNDGSVGARPSVGARVRSFGREAAANGGREEYVWNDTQSTAFQMGTYTYHSGTHPQVQVQMGLYGAVSRDAASGEAYPGVSYATAKDLFFSEVDPALHAAVAGGTYGTPGGPTSTLNYHPKHFLLHSYDAGGLPVDVSIDPAHKTCINGGMTTGSRVLLRLFNAGLRELTPMMIGSHVELVAEGGRRAPSALRQYQMLLPPGSTRDVVFTPGYDGDYALIERRLNLTDGATPNGGMQTCLRVGAGGGNNPPIITSTPVTTAVAGQAYSYDVNATDPEGNALTYSLDVLPAGMTINGTTGLIAWTPAAGQLGSHGVTVRVTDNGSPALFATQSFQVTVSSPNSAPTITSTPVPSAVVGQAYSYDVNATDANAGQTLTYSLDVAPAGMTVNASTGLIAWTPAAGQVGSNGVTVRVTDNGSPPMFATQSFQIAVTAPNSAPTITSTPVTTATVGLAYGYDVNATDANAGQTLTYSLDVAPAGMTVNASTGLIAWTPVAGQVGPNGVTVRVTDNGTPPLFATQSFTINVAPSPSKHVADLDATATIVNAATWQANVTITVHNQNHRPVAGVIVNRLWSPAGSNGGPNNNATCTTNAAGQCQLSRRFSRTTNPSATMSVTTLTGAAGTYQASSNHDPDGDSNGTSITIARP
jgi:hypothetical protein